MKVKKLIKDLQKCNPNHDICLSRFFFISTDDKNDNIEIILDSPICGIYTPNKDSKKTEIRFVLLKDMKNKQFKKFIKNYGSIKKVN